MKALYVFYVGLLFLPSWSNAQDCTGQKRVLSQFSAVQNACPNSYALASLVVDQCEGRIGVFDFNDRAKPLVERMGAIETQPSSACYQAKLKAGLIKGASGSSNNNAYRDEEAEKKRQNDLATQRVQSAADQVLQDSNELIMADFNMDMGGVNNALSNVENTTIDLNSHLGKSTATPPSNPTGQNVAADWSASPERTLPGGRGFQSANESNSTDVNMNGSGNTRATPETSNLSPGSRPEKYNTTRPTNPSDQNTGADWRASSERPQVAATPTRSTKAAPSTWNNHENLFEKFDPNVLYYRTHTPTPGRPRSYGGGIELGEFGNGQPEDNSVLERIKNKFSNWFGGNRSTEGTQSQLNAELARRGLAYSLVGGTAERSFNFFKKGVDSILEDKYMDADAEVDRDLNETNIRSWNVIRRIQKNPRKGFDEYDAMKAGTDHLRIFDDN